MNLTQWNSGEGRWGQKKYANYKNTLECSELCAIIGFKQTKVTYFGN